MLFMRPVAPRIWGFDVRVSGEAQARETASLFAGEPEWAFVPKPGVRKPMSVDRNVWSSLVCCGEGEESPAGFDAAGGVWWDLAAMKQCAEARGVEGLVIAMEIYVPPDADVDEVAASRLFVDCTPGQLPAEFRLCGFDVAGASGCSGFLNCGYERSEREALLPEWEARINGHGLIATYEDAVVFREVTEARAGGHGPFFVYGVYAELIPVRALMQGMTEARGAGEMRVAMEKAIGALHWDLRRDWELRTLVRFLFATLEAQGELAEAAAWMERLVERQIAEESDLEALRRDPS